MRLKKIFKSYVKNLLGISSDKNRPVLPLYQKKLKLSKKCKIECVDHHLSHAASAAYTSGLNNKKALIITMDGSGNGVSNAIWRFEENKITKLVSFDQSSSLAYFYSAATEAMMWRHGSDEWKLMGLAPYGNPKPGALKGLYPEFEDGQLVKAIDFGQWGRWNDHGANHYHGKMSKKLVPFFRKNGKRGFCS